MTRQMSKSKSNPVPYPRSASCAASRWLAAEYDRRWGCRTACRRVEVEPDTVTDAVVGVRTSRQDQKCGDLMCSEFLDVITTILQEP